MKNMINKTIILLAFCLMNNIAFAQNSTKNVSEVAIKQSKLEGSRLVTDSLKLDSLVLSEPIIIDEVVAVVGTRMVLLSDFMSKQIMWNQQNGLDPKSILSEDEKKDILEQLLAQKLLAVTAIADSLEVNEASIFGRVEMRIAELTMQLGSTKAVEDTFNADIHQLREKISYQLFEEELATSMKRKIVENLVITPFEVKKHAKTLSEEEIEIIPRQVTYSHIVKRPSTDYHAKLAVKADLLEIRKRILNGESFSGLARLYSDDKQSASRGGEMDYLFLNGSLAQNFENAVKSMNIGNLSNIIETEFGFHLIELMDIRNNQYKVRHILMRLEMNDEELQAAFMQLDSISTEIKDNKITFADAAKKFSDDEKTKDNGGVILNLASAMKMGVKGQTTKFYLDELEYDSYMVNKLKVGDVSEAFVSYDLVSRDKICKIIMITGDFPEHRANLTDDNHIFESIAFDQKRSDAFDVWMNDKIKLSYVKVMEPYCNTKFKYNWIVSQKGQ